MSLANDLLRNLSAYQVDEQDDTLIIDHYTRTIIIPKHITNLGVEKDDDVLRLNFRMPRKLGEVDLSTFGIRINYINAAGESDAYDASDAEVVGDSLTFSWQVGPLAVAYKGDTQFNVCMIKLKENGEVDREYHTTVASLPVLEGLEVDETLIEPYSDLIEQWRNALFGVGDTEEQRIKDVSAAEQENIAQKGIEVLATIPEDYQTTFSMIDNADRTKSDAIVSTVEGEVITVVDSSDDYLRGLRVFGKTTQVSTTGKNLIDPNEYIRETSGTTLNGDVFTMTTVNGALYLNTGWGGKPATHPAGTYTLSVVPVSNNVKVSVFVYSKATKTALKTHSATPTDGYSVSFTVNEEFYISIGGGTSDMHGTHSFKLQLEVGTIATDYEPYSGGIASPSPNWPQPLNSVENPTVDIAGENLFNFNGITDTANIKRNVDGSITVTLYSAPTGQTLRALAPSLKSGRRYTLFLDTDSSTRILYFLNTKTTWYDTTTMTITEDILNDKVYVYGVNGDAPIIIRDIAIVPEGIEYSGHPYVEKQSVTSQYIISAVPVNIDGDYTDKNGQQWIGDEIDFGRGVRIQRIKHLTLTGNEQIVNVTGDYAIPLSASAYAYDYADRVQCLCNYYPGVSRHDIAQLIKTSGSLGISANINYIRIADTFHYPTANIEAFRQFITDRYNAGDPVVVSYVLATPIETPLTTEETQWFKFAHTNFPNTTVLNDVGATMQLKYNVDTKTYLDNCFRPTDEQVQSSVDAWLSTHVTNAEGVSF